MNDTTKYLIHAEVTADGVVERSDVVGAIFGQTEGLLGDELDLRDLQESSKVGRIDVEVESKSGTSIGEVTIATSLDKVETATLAASLETITRIGPCRSKVEVTNIEDVRAAKRRNVVERATELLMTSFEDTVMSSEEILAKVREKVRVEEVTEYEGLPAGPNVRSSDAMVVVEGRADVLQLLRYGIKNAIGVEGTNVPEAVAELSKNRTVTAFLDGDRGGDLILEELAQVGQVDYVAVAPEDRAVEDLSHHEVFTALREKVPYETVAAADESARAIAESDPSEAPVPDGSTTPATGSETESPKSVPSTNESPAAEGIAPDDSVIEDNVQEGTDDGETEDAGAADTVANDAETGATTSTLEGHVTQVVNGESDNARLLDGDFGVLDEIPTTEAFHAIRDAEVPPTTVVLDDELTQRVLDVAAQRGVDRVIAREKGEFTKRPTGVRVLTTTQLEPA
ncbi:MAG: DNA primase [Halobacteriales archaeon]|jgi:DNA primase